MGIDIFATALYGRSVAQTRRKALAFLSGLDPVMPGWPVRHRIDDDSTVAFSLFADNWIELKFGAEAFEFSARTSNGGPGYHDYVVWLMDRLAGTTGLTWQDGGDMPGDETGYRQSRDFSELQTKMADFAAMFPYLAETLSRDAPPSEAKAPSPPPQICISSKMTPLGDHFVSHAQGPWSREELEELRNPGGEAVRRFFPWWERSRLSGWLRKKWKHPASLYRKFALGLMWSSINWLPPVTGDERKYLSSALACLEEAWKLEPDREYPAAEWLEMADLLEDRKLRDTLEQRFPSALTGAEPRIGYLRGDVRFNFGPWFLRLPGKTHYQLEENGFESFDDGVLHVRVCAFSLANGIDGKQMTTRQWRESEPIQQFINSAREFLLDTPGVSAWIQDIEANLSDRPPFASILTAAMDGSSIRIFVYYDDKQHREKAWNVLRTLSAHIQKERAED